LGRLSTSFEKTFSCKFFTEITKMPRNAFYSKHPDYILSVSQLMRLKHPEPLTITLGRFGLIDLPEEAPSLEQVFPGIAKEGRENITPELLSETGLGEFNSVHLAETIPRKCDYDFENMRFFPGRFVKQANGGFCGGCQECLPAVMRCNSELPEYLSESCVYHEHEPQATINSGYSPLVQVPQTPVRKAGKPTFRLSE